MVIEVKNLKKNYAAKVILNDLSFSVAAGSIVAFLGPNGAGKSTTLKILMGLKKADQGHCKILGELNHNNFVKSQIGYTSQELSFPPHLKIFEILDFVSTHFLQPLPVDQLLNRFDLVKIKNNKAGDLSGGEQRRLGLASALIGRPQILILDEPTTGLDIESRQILWDEFRSFKKSGGSILLSTHDLNEASLVADQVVVLDEGQVLAQGSIAEIKSCVDYKKVCFEVQNELKTEHTQDADLFVKNLVLNKIEFKNIHIFDSTLEEAFLKMRKKK